MPSSSTNLKSVENGSILISKNPRSEQSTLLSWQRAAKNKPKTLKNTSPACLVLEELLLKIVTATRTYARFQEFSIFTHDLERPKCNSGGNRSFLAEGYLNTV